MSVRMMHANQVAFLYGVGIDGVLLFSGGTGADPDTVDLAEFSIVGVGEYLPVLAGDYAGSVEDATLDERVAGRGFVLRLGIDEMWKKDAGLGNGERLFWKWEERVRYMMQQYCPEGGKFTNHGI